MTMRFPARGDTEGSAKLTSDCFEDGLGAGFEEEAGDVFAESGGLVWRCGGALADILRAVDGADAGFENKFAALDTRPGAERNLAAAFQRGEQSAFGDYGGARFRIIESAEDIGGFVVGEAAFRGDCALAHGGEKNIGCESFGYAIAPAQAVQAGFGQEDGVVLAALRFAETSVDVAAKIAHIEVGTNVAKLRLAAQAAGTDARALAKSSKRGAAGRNQAIANVFAAEDGGKLEARGNFGGNVFDAVDREVNRFVHQRVFEFFDENTFATNLG